MVGLNRACMAVDTVAYRPFVVRLTSRLPRWWQCDLARLSLALDDRWGCGYWNPQTGPPVPDGPCEACGRRAAWLVVGGYDPQYDDEPPQPDDYTGNNPIHLCGWCNLPEEMTPIEDDESRQAALRVARARSVAWAWR